MLEIVRKIYSILDARERRNAVILCVMILFTGVMEAVGVVSIMPFLAVLSNPDVIQENVYLSQAYATFGFTDTNTFLFYLGLAVFIMVVFGLSLQALTQYTIARFSHMRNYSLSSKLLRGYLSRPYSYFLGKHSSDMGKSILSEVQQVITGVLLPIALFFANIVIAFCLLLMLFMVNPVVALFEVLLLGGAYILLYAFLRKYLSRIGAQRVRDNRERFQIAQEVFGGIKEVKAGSLEGGYVRSFKKAAFRFSKTQAASMIAGQVPKFALMGLAFGGILIIALYLLVTEGGQIENIIPVLGVFAFGGQRLLPALQQLYQNAAKIRFGKPALDELYFDIKNSNVNSEEIQRINKARKPPPMGVKRNIELKDVEYRYPNSAQPALNDLNLNISAKSTVGFVGSTGAGKTTAVDLILGLLTPTKGEMKVDGKPISSVNINSWQRTIGYVPQDIFLADDTVTANIAFGVPNREVDSEAVERAAKIAELHGFVVNELSSGYETVVGERGVRLSGGQRQRIGIARALYHNPDVLVMDEATASLDNLTEKIVMEAVHNLGHRKTIIMIAHRLSTVQDCDCIFMLENGHLTAQGTYGELIKNHQPFKKMAAVN